MNTKKKRPTDLNQRAKMIADIATGEIEEEKDTRNPAAVAMGRMRAEKYTSEELSLQAKKSAETRRKNRSIFLEVNSLHDNVEKHE